MKSRAGYIPLLAALQLLTADAATADPAAAELQKPVKQVIAGQQMFVVGFDKLAAFEYTVVDSATGASEEEMAQARTRDQIPAWVRLYDKQQIALT
jgi:hypothetical protein